MNKIPFAVFSLRDFKNIFWAVLCCLLPVSAFAQYQDETFADKHPISYNDFLIRLAEHNLEYASQKFNINIAEAEIEAAKILPDPEFSIELADNQQRRMKLGYSVEAELSWDLELGGKRRARTNLAMDEKLLAELELQQFFRELRADATNSFLESIKSKMLYDIRKESHQRLMNLYQSDSVRHADGLVKNTNVLKSKLEARSVLNDMQDAMEDWEISLIELRSIINKTRNDTVFTPHGDLEGFDRDFDLNELIDRALENRADLIAARQNKSVAARKIDLAKAERALDLGLTLGVENNTYAKNAIGPTPGFVQIKAGLSVPLKFSNNRESGLKNAIYEELQADLEYRVIELALEKEITLAYRHYINKQEQVRNFKTGTLEEARHIYDETLKHYEKGESSLLELLDAERTYTKIKEDYAETLFEYASALVDLEDKAGIWDIDF